MNHGIENPDTTPDAFARLTPLGWSSGLVVVLIMLAASFLLAGYFVVYWRNADMDFMVVYSALSLNDGMYAFFPHPAYLTIVSVSRWFQLLHNLGLLEASSLSAIPSASNSTAFDAAMTSAVRAARVLTFATAVLFILVFAGLARLLTRDWRTASFATFAFAFSGGMAVHMRILRSEMIAGCFLAFALMILIVAARRGTAWRPLAIGLVAALCVLALENKIQAILLIAVLPGLILPFGLASSASAPFWNNGARSAWLMTIFAMLIAAVSFHAIVPLLTAGLKGAAPDVSLQPLLWGRFGVYQIALLIWIGMCMVAFGVVWRITMVEIVTSILAAIGGGAVGLMALYIAYDASNVVIVLNPIEEMMTFADARAVKAVDGGGLMPAVSLLLSGVASVLQRYTFFLFTSARPTVFLTWLIFPGIVLAWRRGEKKVAVQAGLLMIAAIGIDALGIRRGLKAEYFIFTDPLIIVAGALLLDCMSDLRFRKWTYSIGASLIACHLGISQAEPVKFALKRTGPENICDWNESYLPKLPLPWCNRPAKGDGG